MSQAVFGLFFIKDDKGQSTHGRLEECGIMFGGKPKDYKNAVTKQCKKMRLDPTDEDDRETAADCLEPEENIMAWFEDGTPVDERLEEKGGHLGFSDSFIRTGYYRDVITLDEMNDKVAKYDMKRVKLFLEHYKATMKPEWCTLPIVD